MSRETNAQDLARRFGITTTTLNMYVDGDGMLEEPGQKLLGPEDASNANEGERDECAYTEAALPGQTRPAWGVGMASDALRIYARQLRRDPNRNMPQLSRQAD